MTSAAGRRRLIACGALLALAWGAVARGEGNEPVRLHGMGSGRYEVVSAPGTEGVRLAELAAAAWTEWTTPLGLPPRLPIAITVRLVPEAAWPAGGEPWRVAVEQAGLVSVWIRAGGDPGVERDRRWLEALAEGALRRKALLAGVALERTKAPAWLRAAAAQAMLVAEQPSMLDAWQAQVEQGSAGARLRDVLLWEGNHGAGDAEARRRAAFGIWLWLREESGRSGAWERFIQAVISGESPGLALAREFGRLIPKPAEAREWELAWRVAKARLATARTTPILGAAESKAWIERVARIAVMDSRTGEERILPLWGEWASREEPWLRGERAERARLISANFSRLHPFYRNAAGSLGRAWVALTEGREEAWREASVEWAQDLQDGRALQEASRRLLDEASAQGSTSSR